MSRYKSTYCALSLSPSLHFTLVLNSKRNVCISREWHVAQLRIYKCSVQRSKANCILLVRRKTVIEWSHVLLPFWSGCLCACVCVGVCCRPNQKLESYFVCSSSGLTVRICNSGFVVSSHYYPCHNGIYRYTIVVYGIPNAHARHIFEAKRKKALCAMCCRKSQK